MRLLRRPLIVAVVAGAVAAPAQAATITEFPVPAAIESANSIATGGDRALWMTSPIGEIPEAANTATKGLLLRFDPATRTFKIVPELSGQALGIVGTSTGRLVYTTGGRPAGVVVFDPVINARLQGPSSYSGVFALSAGPAGSVVGYGYIPQPSGISRDLIVRVDGATGAVVTLADLGTQTGLGSTLASPDGRVFFLAGGGTANPGRPLVVGVHDPATASTRVVATVPDTAAAFTGPYAGVRAPDGRLYFGVTSSRSSNGIVRFDPATGAVAFLPAPDGVKPRSMVVGPDGAIWYVGGPYVVRLATDSATSTVYAVPSAQTSPLSGLTVGPDGALWFSEFLGGNIGRIEIAGNASVGNLATALARGLGALVECRAACRAQISIEMATAGSRASAAGARAAALGARAAAVRRPVVGRTSVKLRRGGVRSVRVRISPSARRRFAKRKVVRLRLVTRRRVGTKTRTTVRRVELRRVKARVARP